MPSVTLMRAPDERQRRLNYTTATITTCLEASQVSPGVSIKDFSYNTKNLLRTHPEKGAVTYGRDNVGNMTSKTDGLGGTSYVYDALRRLTTINYGTGTATFTYDNANNRATMVNPSASATSTYDASNRLTKRKRPFWAGSTTQYIRQER
jgi:YD repeat-containing protein